MYVPAIVILGARASTTRPPPAAERRARLKPLDEWLEASGSATAARDAGSFWAVASDHVSASLARAAVAGHVIGIALGAVFVRTCGPGAARVARMEHLWGVAVASGR